MILCDLCGNKVGYNDQWTEEMAEKEFAELKASLIEFGFPKDEVEYDTGSPVCNDCYQMLTHQTPPTKEFIINYNKKVDRMWALGYNEWKKLESIK